MSIWKQEDFLDYADFCFPILFEVSRSSAFKNVLDANFIEGMACVGGCVGGAGCLTHGEKNRADVEKYGEEATKKSILEAVDSPVIEK